MVSKAFGRLMDGKNGRFAFVFHEVCGFFIVRMDGKIFLRKRILPSLALP